MTSEEDRDLRERFAALRREEEAGAPAIDRLVARARHRREARRGRRVVAALAVGVVLLVDIGLWPLRKPAHQPVPSITEWRSHTDFLLQMPGREILDTLPRFGEGLVAPDSNERRPPS